MNGAFVHAEDKKGQENLLTIEIMVIVETISMMNLTRWHCPSDSELDISTMLVWGRARYLSVNDGQRLGPVIACIQGRTSSTSLPGHSDVMPSKVVHINLWQVISPPQITI